MCWDFEATFDTCCDTRNVFECSKHSQSTAWVTLGALGLLKTQVVKKSNLKRQSTGCRILIGAKTTLKLLHSPDQPLLHQFYSLMQITQLVRIENILINIVFLHIHPYLCKVKIFKFIQSMFSYFQKIQIYIWDQQNWQRPPMQDESAFPNFNIAFTPAHTRHQYCLCN